MEIMRFRFKRTKELRLISHLDMQRLFGRAFRRADIPLSYSQGFNPHPKLSFAGALPFGMITYDEYGDVCIDKEIPLQKFVSDLNAAMPTGLEILSVKKISGKTPSLSAALIGADFRVSVFIDGEIDENQLKSNVNSFMEQNEIIIEKRNKKGKKVDTDIRSYIRSFMFVKKKNDELIFDLSLNYIDQKCVKPVLVLSALDKMFKLNMIIDETILLVKIKNHFSIY